MRLWIIGGFLLWLGTAIYAQSATEYPKVEIGVGPSFSWGKAQEEVFYSATASDFRSLIVYPVNPSLGAQVSASIKWLPWLKTNLFAEYAWQLAEGNVTDDDWLNGGSGSQSKMDIHSDSRGFQTANVQLRGEFAFPISVDEFNICPLIGIESRLLAWQAWDVLQNTVGYKLYGQGLDYKQNWIIPYIGFETSASSELVYLQIGLRFSPYMSMQDTDIHILTKYTYLDNNVGGWMLNPSFLLGLKLSPKYRLDFGFEFQTMQGARGDVYQYQDGNSDKTAVLSKGSNQAGGTLETFTASVLLRVTL